MKKLRISKWHGQRHGLSACVRPRSLPTTSQRSIATTLNQKTSAEAASTNVNTLPKDNIAHLLSSNKYISNQFLSPSSERALKSAKLAALHARLTLPKRLPLQTLAITLVDPSADPDPRFNNAALARLGKSILSYHIGEYLICTYPRLPLSVLFAASYAYNGPKTLQLITNEWGVEIAAAPGPEVDPGLLQFSKLQPGANIENTGPTTRPDVKDYFRRGMSSRLVYDDEFGDKMPLVNNETAPAPTEKACAGFVGALIGAIYVHAGRQTAKSFIKQYILSRYLDISTLFQFQNPIRELARLCNREGFELPIARILSETGRWSRSPLFSVGIFSGQDLLGSSSGASLPEARIRACVAALKSWYLYSPGNSIRVPSDTEGHNCDKHWEPAYIDIGEIVLS
ncbi:54S ribosomal protein L3, mitochondrial [Erysiphe necator]|uniref:Large ribosomal subunit protein mL44 n=1 Tax=Uncinula necator TaxID=52586 RepID=A0A0B1PC25_UNCNE|nr:54S ribosomal protein L3, mitochondrial [Erysiphe necator]KHJ34516.1 putative 60s ribosomal protein l3 [Erysiphe necator]